MIKILFQWHIANYTCREGERESGGETETRRFLGGGALVIFFLLFFLQSFYHTPQTLERCFRLYTAFASFFHGLLKCDSGRQPMSKAKKKRDQNFLSAITQLACECSVGCPLYTIGTLKFGTMGDCKPSIVQIFTVIWQ